MGETPGVGNGNVVFVATNCQSTRKQVKQTERRRPGGGKRRNQVGICSIEDRPFFPRILTLSGLAHLALVMWRQVPGSRRQELGPFPCLHVTLSGPLLEPDTHICLVERRLN